VFSKLIFIKNVKLYNNACWCNKCITYKANDVFKASTDILFKSAERFSGCLRVLIHCLIQRFVNIAVHFIRARSNLIPLKYGNNPKTSQHF